MNLQASASYAKIYHCGSHFGTFEAGFKIRNGHKFDDSFDPQSTRTGTSLVNHPECASSFTDPNYYDHTYGKTYGTNLADWSKIRNWAMTENSNLSGGPRWSVVNGTSQFNYVPGKAR